METKPKAKASSQRTDAIMRLELIISCVLAVVGVGVLIAGFCVPPQGEIHGSVLIAFGEILTWVGTVCGMRYNYKYKAIKH